MNSPNNQNVPDFTGDSAQTVASTPTMLGRFRLLRVLGAGGMGQVYLAHDEDLDEMVALKIIKPEYLETPHAEERFKRELAVARRVTHSNVIRIHDMGVADGTRYISMPFIDGEDLSAMLGRGVPPIERALSMARQVCEGLAAAHRCGVVHRDLKPGNVMVDRAGRAYVMDFGLAHAADTGSITGPGVMLGTVDYMSPEQARGEPADQRSDLYAFGLILFQLLTGQLAFSGDTPLSRLSARLHGVPDLAALRSDLPPYVRAIVTRCLARDPAARYQSADDVLQAFNGGERAVSQASSRRGRAVRWAIALVVLLGVTAAGFVLWRAGGPSPAPARTAAVEVIAAAPFHNATADAALDWLGRAVAARLAARLHDDATVSFVSTDRLQQVVDDLKIDSSAMTTDDAAASLREFTSATAVISGEVTRAGDSLQIRTSLRRAGAAAVPLPAVTATLDEVDAAAARLAEFLVVALGKAPATGVGETTVRIGPASRLYYEAIDLTRLGRFSDAVQRLADATAIAPDVGAYWSALAAAHAGLNQNRDAAVASRRAVELSAEAPARERLEIVARDAMLRQENRQAITAYEQLVAAAPNDSAARFVLAGLYETVGSFDLARREFTMLLSRDPSHVDALLGSGRVAIRKGEPRDAIDPLTRALSLAVRLDNDTQRAAAQQALGVAYKRLNRPLDALQAYEQALELRRRLGLKGATAASLTEIGQIRLQLGKPDEAEQAYGEALTIRRAIGDRDGEKNSLINLGDLQLQRGQLQEAIRSTTDALAIARSQGNEDSEALCLSNIGNMHAELGDSQTATVFLEQSLAIRRRLRIPAAIAISLHNLAIIAESTGDFATAIRLLLEARELEKQRRDDLAVAYKDYELSLIHRDRGHLRASMEAARSAVSAVRPGEDPWYPEIAARHAASRALLGDCAGVVSTFDESVRVSSKIGFPRSLSYVLMAQAEGLLGCGDTAAATTAAERAVSVASQYPAPPLALAANIHLARVRNASGRHSEAHTVASSTVSRAERLNLRPVAAAGLVEVAEAALAQGQYDEARRAAERALELADRLQAVVLLARANHAAARTLEALGLSSEAARRTAEARQLVEQIRKEAAADTVLQRRDLRQILGSRP